MAGATALPRENGELVFDAPSQGRIFGLALGVVRARGIDWEEFRQRLMAAIEADPAGSTTSHGSRRSTPW